MSQSIESLETNELSLQVSLELQSEEYDDFEDFLSVDYREVIRKEITSTQKDESLIVKTSQSEAERILKELQEEQENDHADKYDLHYSVCPVCCLEFIRNKPIKVQHIKDCAVKNGYTPGYVVELMAMCQTTRVMKKPAKTSPKKPRGPRNPKNELFEIQIYGEEYKKNKLKARIDKILGVKISQDSDDSYLEEEETEEEQSFDKTNISSKASLTSPMPHSWTIASINEEYNCYILTDFAKYFLMPEPSESSKKSPLKKLKAC